MKSMTELVLENLNERLNVKGKGHAEAGQIERQTSVCINSIVRGGRTGGIGMPDIFTLDLGKGKRTLHGMQFIAQASNRAISLIAPRTVFLAKVAVSMMTNSAYPHYLPS
jgi:hypothetical protein